MRTLFLPQDVNFDLNTAWWRKWYFLNEISDGALQGKVQARRGQSFFEDAFEENFELLVKGPVGRECDALGFVLQRRQWLTGGR